MKLSGLWLDGLGFSPQKRVTVTTMDKLLIIRLDE
ncbi:SymE family type I addiction module toxin [Sphingobacterium paucimobilis]